MNFTTYYGLLMLIMCWVSSASAQVSDDFSDGDFITDPAWIGDFAEFEVDAAFELHLMGPDATDESHLSTPSTAINNAQWDLDIRMDFNPSGSNRTYVYLCADQSDLESALNGYFVMIGNSSDEISLYRQDGISTTKIIDGTDATVDLDPVELSLRVIRDDAGNWELLHDIGLTGSFTSEGTVLDDTYESSQFFGLRCDYTSTRSELFWFDNILVTGDGFIDEVAPTLTSVTLIDANSVSLEFSEALDPLTAEDEANYTLLPSTNPITASLTGNEVILDFSADFPENVTQTIQVESVTDLAGNPIETSSDEFVFVALGAGVPGDVVINELMADPNPVIGLPEAEFIELYNTSDSAFDLLDWNLTNSGTDEFLESYVLLPGAYVIICNEADAAEFSSYGPVLAVSSLTALSNGGDDLRLFNPDFELIDEVIYDISWYGGNPFDDGGYSLERINPNLPCDNPSNWIASQSPDGGTPGQENSVFEASDMTAPLLENVQVVDNSTIILTFNEGMDELSLITGTYTISGAGALVPVPITDIREVTLNIDPPLDAGASYELTVEGVTDCSGNEIESVTFNFVISAEAEPGDILFNEIMADPSPAIGLPELEYIELYQNSEKIFDLGNWVFRNTTTEIELPSITFAPGEYIILCDADTAEAFEAYGTVIGLDGFPPLSNSGDDIYLLDPEGTEIDQVIYTSAWYNDPQRDEGGYSLERINPDRPCSDQSNWRASTDIQGGTPGMVNAVLDLSPDETAPEALSLIQTGPQQLRILFSEAILIDDVNESNVMSEPSLSITEFIQNTIYELRINLDEPLDSGVVYTIQISGITDCSGNEMLGVTEFQTALPLAYEEGDIIINEVLFNPRTMGVDFVELYNNSPRPISLRNWKMANREMGELADIATITAQDVLLLPHEFIVLSEDPENIRNEYPLGVPRNYLEIDDLPSYPDDEGYVVLLDPAIEVHDEFFYNEDYHFSLLDDLNGVSLERVDYDRLTNDPTNWHSAAENVGWATPGYENSQLQPSNGTSESFSIEPEVFSPDNDGFQDLLLINYSLDGPGYIANISIFDRDGRPVRMLTRNELLSTKGTISWDGINDEGAKARIGVYVLFIEIFDQEGNVSSTKKTAVLGGRF